MATITGTGAVQAQSATISGKAVVTVTVASVGNSLALSDVQAAVRGVEGIPQKYKDAAESFNWVEIGAILNEMGEHNLELPPELTKYTDPILEVIKAVLA